MYCEKLGLGWSCCNALRRGHELEIGLVARVWEDCYDLVLQSCAIFF